MTRVPLKLYPIGETSLKRFSRGIAEDVSSRRAQQAGQGLAAAHGAFAISQPATSPASGQPSGWGSVGEFLARQSRVQT